MIDPDVLRDLQEIIGGSRADLLELVTEFLHDAPIQLNSMAAAAAASDVETVRRGAHSLKSNGRDLGAMIFAQLCADLEGDLNTPGLVGEPIVRVQVIVALWPQVRSALEAEISKSEAGS